MQNNQTANLKKMCVFANYNLDPTEVATVWLGLLLS